MDNLTLKKIHNINSTLLETIEIVIAKNEKKINELKKINNDLKEIQNILEPTTQKGEQVIQNITNNISNSSNFTICEKSFVNSNCESVTNGDKKLNIKRNKKLIFK